MLNILWGYSMDFRTYKNSEEKISLLGFGCMRLPVLNEKQSDIDIVKAQEMVDYAISHGVNYFDTAYVYHEEQSENFIGEALSKYPRTSFNLASKMPTWSITCKDDVERIFDEQLKKCRVDYFDYYLIHNLSEETFKICQNNDIYALLKEKQKAGKIRRLGFSFHDRPEILQQIIQSYSWDFAQIQLNYFDWEHQDAKLQYELLYNNNIPIVIMEPVRGGNLAELCEDSVKIFKAQQPNLSVASWALRYVASLPGILTVLSGMSELSQVEDNVKTVSDFKPLVSSDYETIEKALTQYRLAGAVPCTACRYCMDCPSGVEIPKVFAIYNRHKTLNNAFLFGFEYKLLGKDRQAHHCVSCNVCKEHCPQGIDIPGEMKTISLFAEKMLASEE